MASVRFLLLLLATALGCASTDRAYVSPRTIDVDPASYIEARLIAYRPLVRADFRASYAPAGMENIGAVTAALIRTSRVTFLTRSDETAGKRRFIADVNSLVFEARMSQNHSWWNPGHRTAENDLLVHEQVHFAFSELAVRRANANLAIIRSRIRSIAATPEDAIRCAADRLQHEVDRLQKEVNARNEQFDRETVNGRRCEVNRAWFDLVQRELEQSRATLVSASHH